jgi:hypothetical protein
MLEALFLLAQSPISCAQRVPIVVCQKRKVVDPTYRVAPQYFVRQTNGSSEIQVNRCSYLAANVGKSFQYVPESKWCD